MTTASNLEVRALRYLARREYSRLELETKLLIKSPDSTHESVSAVLDKLEQYGYLSAQRVIELVIQTRRHKFGSLRIVNELKEKGIEEHLIAAALPELKETDLDAACGVRQKKFGASPGNIKERGKQVRFLMSRGFSSEIIYQVLSRANKEKI